MKLFVFLAVTCLTLVGSALSQQQTSAAADPPTPSPTPTPTPTPSPANNTCNVTTSKPNSAAQSYAFKTCVVAKFAAYYTLGPNQYVELKNGKVDETSSKCEANATDGKPAVNPEITIKFDCGELHFVISKSQTQVFVQAIQGKINANGTTTDFANSTASGLFSTAADHHYKCNTEQSVEAQDNKTSLVLSDFSYEAYRSATGTEFYKITEECALDSSQVSDLVRIGVGICLFALVALVLVAYFVGRRRWAERSSYESV